MNFLIATNNSAFLNEATLIIEKELTHIKLIQDVLTQSELVQKMAKKKFETILIDINTCPIDTPIFEKLTQLIDTKVKVVSEHHADIPNEFFNQKSIQLLSMSYPVSTKNLKGLILNTDNHLWGEETKQFTLYNKEVLCHENSVGNAVYLIKEGFLQREFPDGTILDGSIGAGKMIGELAYFNREPRKWNVVAAENCTLVRISYDKIDKQLENQPSWIKIMFTSLAERSLKYAETTVVTPQ